MRWRCCSNTVVPVLSLDVERGLLNFSYHSPLLMTDSTPNSGPPAHSLRLTSPTRTSAYVRIAKPSEISALAAVYARAFARDPQMNWLGSVRAPVLAEHIGDNGIDDLNCDASARRTLAGLQHFQLVVAKMAQIQGLVVVVVEKEVSKEGEGHREEQGEGEKERVSEGENLKERIVGGALWLKPGASMDPSPLTFVRISPWRSIWSWGLRGLKVCVYYLLYLLCMRGSTRQRRYSPPSSHGVCL
jgi:hypothetical protein